MTDASHDPQSDMTPAAAPTKTKAFKPVYTGELPNLARLGAINAALSVVSLGGYFSKAQTDLCLWGVRHLRLGKIPLSYTGSMIAFVRQVLPFGAAAAVTALLLHWSVVSMNYLLFFVFAIALYGLIYAGFYAALRFRLNHLKLGGAAFALQLKVWRYMLLFMKRAFFNLVSFGYAIPKSDLEKWALVASRLQLGDTRFTFTGSVKPVFWTHLISLGLPLILGLTFILMLGPVLSGDPAIDQQRIAASQQVLTFLLYCTLICGALGRSWYQAELRAECLRGLRCGNLRFRSTATGHDLFKLRVVNWMILAVTLGLGWGIAKHRTLEFYARTIAVQGDIEAVTTA